MLHSFQRYPGTALGLMAAVGSVKVGAILWETTFSAWPLLHVLTLPLIGGGLALGIGIGHDHLFSVSTARRLGIAGLLVSSAVAARPLLGPALPALAWLGTVPIGPALIGVALGRGPLSSMGPVSSRPSARSG